MIKVNLNTGEGLRDIPDQATSPPETPADEIQRGEVMEALEDIWISIAHLEAGFLGLEYSAGAKLEWCKTWLWGKTPQEVVEQLREYFWDFEKQWEKKE